jgi:Sulfotransferase family
MPEADCPIIIGGSPRSGTSLIRRILNSHSRIYCGPEVHFFRDFHGNYQGDPFRHLRFMSTARTMVPERDLLDVTGRAFITLHERAAAQAGKQRWADKNPMNVLYLADWQYLLGDGWGFVHVVRNPLDTLASITEAVFPLSIPRQLEQRVDLVCQSMKLGLDFEAAYPERYYRVVYEHLVTEPERALRSLMAWMGERFEPAQLSFNNVEHQSGLEDPKITATTKIHADSIGRWKTMLASDAVDLIKARSWSLWRRCDPDNRYGFVLSTDNEAV